MVKNLPAYAGDTGDLASIPGPGRSPGVGNDNPLQYSCLENSMGLAGYSLQVHKESDTTERLTLSVSHPTFLDNWTNSLDMEMSLLSKG